MSEQALIERIVAHLRGLPADGVTIDAGDDGAALRLGAGCELVVSVDAHVEGVHYRPDWLTREQAGYRALMAAASDLAAMGAHPRAALVALTAPAGVPEEELFAVLEGCFRAGQAARTRVVGGNLARARDLTVTTTVLGEVAGRALRREGARAGDGLYLTGEAGVAALGRAVLAHADRARLESTPAGRLAAARFREPVPKLLQGERLRELATACIDVSDGLALDALRLARASRVRLRIDASTLVVAPSLLALASELSLSPRALALGGGDDYELLYTAPAGDSVAEIGTRIGEVLAGEPGLEVVDDEGRPVAPERGWDHFH